MGRIYWTCPITAEQLAASVEPGEVFQLHVSAAGAEALEALYGPGAEEAFWEARRLAGKGDAKAHKLEAEFLEKAKLYTQGF